MGVSGPGSAGSCAALLLLLCLTAATAESVSGVTGDAGSEGCHRRTASRRLLQGAPPASSLRFCCRELDASLCSAALRLIVSLLCSGCFKCRQGITHTCVARLPR